MHTYLPNMTYINEVDMKLLHKENISHSSICCLHAVITETEGWCDTIKCIPENVIPSKIKQMFVQSRPFATSLLFFQCYIAVLI